ncbi:transposase is4 [Holotrichia oblita]|uniref:Transposase is4 n=1 Tax=Holotrichia oblita TaxID=644536 RepID=A0ACB9SU30_HOLOL|nr:transposase is4 [Holotrichia oblita]
MLAILEATSSEEDVGGEEDDSENEYILQSDHDSSSEVGISEGADEMDSESEEENVFHGDFFLGRNKSTKWQKKPVMSRFSKTPKKNLVKILSRPYQNAMNIRNELDAFQKFFTNDIIDSIVLNTNKFVVTTQNNYARERTVTNTELLGFFGLLFLSRLKKANNTNFRELWAQDGARFDLFAVF